MQPLRGARRNPQQLPRVLETAIRTAIGRRGVAVIVLPGDVSLKPAPENPVPLSFPAPPSVGIRGIRISESSALEDGIRAALAHEGPVLVDVVTAKQELAMPPKIQLEQAKGFSLFVMKAILNGRGDEVMELARTNLRGKGIW